MADLVINLPEANLIGHNRTSLHATLTLLTVKLCLSDTCTILTTYFTGHEDGFFFLSTTRVKE